MDAHPAVSETIPVRLRVPHVQFLALCAQAEADREAAPRDEYVAGVVVTCRWLLGRPVWSPISRRAEMPRSPVLYREIPVTPEAVDVEYAAAVGPQTPRDVVFAHGVAATLAWVWVGSSTPPLDLSA